MEGESGHVCVTGAGGFAASWVVKLLLSQGYIVHGTIRQPGDSKYEHLNKLEKASENLKLFKADLLDYDSLCSAISGCSGVFHVASPVLTTEVKDPKAEVLEPAVRGTLNVLKASLVAKVKRVVLVSSTAAVVMNPNWPKDQVKDESCWSDVEYIKSLESMKTSKKWYYVSKTQAESEALEFGKRTGLEVVTVCSSAILGPVLQSTLISSSWLLPMGLKGGFGSFGYNYWTVVDVRDLAEALLLAYKKAEAGERYICTSHAMGVEEVVEKYLKVSHPKYNYSDKLSHTDEEEEEEKVSSEKLQKLGWSYRPFEETLADSIECCRKIGVLD
ncbi:cinnamoyl-CoA reductase 1-like [Argentina anserina]|uniref:cinnamoyl-CoA reductase 1-like n=1 Tax=Argentina anserina TaxID=57926 RepID=UPI0021765F85|nr:cinnamoyl-CoA reductase 1-like [Potentilla anserina]